MPTKKYIMYEGLWTAIRPLIFKENRDAPIGSVHYAQSMSFIGSIGQQKRKKKYVRALKTLLWVFI